MSNKIKGKYTRKIRDQIRDIGLPYLFITLFVLLLFRFQWSSILNFTTALDRGNVLLQDFESYYYPMGKQIIQNPEPIAGYYYSSFFALILSPLGNVPEVLAATLWTIFQVLFVMGYFISILLLIPGITSSNSKLLFFLCLSTYPILNNFKWGQVSVMLTTITLMSFYLLSRRKPILSGILLAFATSIKFYPILFIAIYFIRREHRATFAFITALVIFYCAFPVAVLGLSNWVSFEKMANAEITGAGWLARDINSQYFAHVGLRWFEYIFNRPGGSIIESTLFAIGLVIAFFCLTLSYQFYKNNKHNNLQLSILLIFISTPFLIKSSWPHYFVYLPFGQLLLLDFLSKEKFIVGFQKYTAMIFIVFSIIFSNIFMFNIISNWAIFNSYGFLFVANGLLLVPTFIFFLRRIPEMRQP